jgi:hypothetical protein
MSTQTTTPRWVAGGLLALLMILAFALQSYNVGFWSFRHGWTSVHGMALFSRAEPQNRFVGYSMMVIDENGDPVYEYFDRYPPFFSVSVNLLMSLADDIPTEIYLARLYMNIFFAGSLFFGYRLARLFLRERLLAVAVVAFGFSSFYLLYYRDMIDYYQPVAMNFLVMAYSIARYQLHGERRQVFIVAALLTLVSFGYAMLFILGVWFVVDTARLWLSRDRKVTIGHRFRQTVLQPSVAAILISLALTVLSIGNNVLTEADIREVPVTETSVVDSILRRLPFVEGAVAVNVREQAATTEGVGGWGSFLLVEFERLMKWSLPLRTGGATGVRFVPGISTPMIVWSPKVLASEVTTYTTPDTVLLNGWLLVAGVGLVAVLVVWLVRLQGHLRDIALITAFGGFPLVFGLINLTSVHDYTLMFALGFNVMLWTALLRWADDRSRLAATIAVIGIGLFSVSAWQVRTVQMAEVELGAPYTYDFDRIRDVIGNDRNTVYLNYPRANPECIIRNWQCFALGYYLGDNYLTTHPEYADYALSPQPYYLPNAFVEPGTTAQIVAVPTHPENEVAYLLDISQAQERTTPTNSTQLFGDHLALGAWSLLGDVTVAPCERATVESWWTVDTLPDENLNLQIVLVAEDGSAISEANAPLGTVPTSIWEPGLYTADARSILVPCDTPSGSYPLIMGVYDPATLEPLSVTGADGTVIGNQLYLTNLIVEGGAS